MAEVKSVNHPLERTSVVLSLTGGLPGPDSDPTGTYWSIDVIHRGQHTHYNLSHLPTQTLTDLGDVLVKLGEHELAREVKKGALN